MISPSGLNDESAIHASGSTFMHVIAASAMYWPARSARRTPHRARTPRAAATPWYGSVGPPAVTVGPSGTALSPRTAGGPASASRRGRLPVRILLEECLGNVVHRRRRLLPRLLGGP